MSLYIGVVASKNEEYHIISSREIENVIDWIEKNIDGEKLDWGYIWSGKPDKKKVPQRRVFVDPQYIKVSDHRFHVDISHVKVQGFKNQKANEIDLMKMCLTELQKGVDNGNKVTNIKLDETENEGS